MMSLDMSSFLDERGHVPATEMARYLDGTSDRPTRSRLVQHLAECDECREELTALRRLVPTRSSLTTRVGTVLGAAAAVVLITMSWRGSLTSSIDELDRTRAQGGVAEIDAPIPIVFPSPDANVLVDSARLIWRAAGPDAAYIVAVQDESGGVVFSTETSDTTVTLPVTAFPQSARNETESLARTYFWSVQARLLDGRSRRTELHRFHIR